MRLLLTSFHSQRVADLSLPFLILSLSLFLSCSLPVALLFYLQDIITYECSLSVMAGEGENVSAEDVQHYKEGSLVHDESCEKSINYTLLVCFSLATRPLSSYHLPSSYYLCS